MSKIPTKAELKEQNEMLVNSERKATTDNFTLRQDNKRLKEKNERLEFKVKETGRLHERTYNREALYRVVAEIMATQLPTTQRNAIREILDNIEPKLPPHLNKKKAISDLAIKVKLDTTEFEDAMEKLSKTSQKPSKRWIRQMARNIRGMK